MKLALLAGCGWRHDHEATQAPVHCQLSRAVRLTRILVLLKFRLDAVNQSGVAVPVNLPTGWPSKGLDRDQCLTIRRTWI